MDFLLSCKTDRKNKNRKYAVSNKLDGTKYILFSYEKRLYAINDVDGMYICDGDVDDNWYDGEWDGETHTFMLFDEIVDDNQNYISRLKHVEAVVKKIKSKYIRQKYVLVSGNAAKDTDKILKWMRTTYGKKWIDRNDGIIYTPINEPYTANKEREHRTLKYKFPDKISIDVKLRKDRFLNTEKHFTAVDSTGIPIKNVKIVVYDSEEIFDEAKDGVIAEVGFRDKAFYIMRLRPDKVYPNHISTIESTLSDMYDPITVKSLLQYIRGGAAAHEDLLPDITEEQIQNAKKFIAQDRQMFWPIYKTILEFIKSEQLKVSSPDCIVCSELPNQFKIYSSTALTTANNLANKLFEHSEIVYMKTVIPYEEFEISVLGRTIVKVFNYPKLKFIKTDEIFTSVPVTIDNYKLEALDPYIELIEIYHRLYMPFPDNWDENLKIEESLYKLLVSGGGVEHKNERTELLKTVRYAIFDSLEHEDLGILIGHWAYHDLVKTKNKLEYEKIQLITSLEPDVVVEKIENILRDVTPLKLSFKTDEVYIPYDMNIRRTTYYFEFKNTKIALMDTFNSTSYEIVPFVLTDRKVKIGNPYVLCRFFLIDIFVLKALCVGGLIPEDVLEKKKASTFNCIKNLREKRDLVFGDEYDGVYKDFAIERRRILKREEKFFPYKPLDSIRKYGKLRTI
jgi:hypothetical protein